MGVPGVAAVDRRVHASQASHAATAVALHCLFLAVWGWHLAEAHALHLKFVDVFSTPPSLARFALCAYALRLLVVVPSAAVADADHGSGEVCFLDTGADAA